MTVYHETFEVQSDRRPTFDDVTEQVREILGRSGIRNGNVPVSYTHLDVYKRQPITSA